MLSATYPPIWSIRLLKALQAADISWLAAAGISTGYENPDGAWRFEGMATVKRQDMAAFLHRLVGLDH